ncbi:NADH dehydrogenase [Planococcus kocurii]|uniref:NADH dehydrogenase n=1 Tax=Planococcus kocurii TaxID=1374 RepID=A0ABN4JX05_9BACL|nr:DUF1129 family protein [Planococcus kocurii]ALS78475.1 NADH dehydrogenase [Planococcus kocurii]
MLSAKSEQFLLELRMYLIQHGKSDEDINSIVEELESHLVESEKKGKSVESIVGNDPKQYIKSIGKTLPTEKKELFVLIPSTILVILSYLCYVPAIEGNFRVSQNILLWGSIIVLLTLAVYAFVLFKGLPKLHNSPVKFGLLMVGVNALVIGTWVGLYFWMNQKVDSNYFVATPEQSYIIVAFCILVFILYALYTKSWITIIVAGVMSVGSIVERLIPKEINEDPFYISLTLIGMLIIAVLLILYFIRKSKKKTNSI